MENFPNQFEVIEISFDEDSLRDEFMGTKEKFWFSFDNEPEEMWLFKYPRANTGEHWAEKIAEQICLLLNIDHARVELAEYSNSYATVTKSFVGNSELYHENEVLPLVVTDYRSAQMFNQSDHTLDNIFRSLKVFFHPYGNSEIVAAKRQIANYFVIEL